MQLRRRICRLRSGCSPPVVPGRTASPPSPPGPVAVSRDLARALTLIVKPPSFVQRALKAASLLGNRSSVMAQWFGLLLPDEPEPVCEYSDGPDQLVVNAN